jgi:mRNA interferase MazF
MPPSPSSSIHRGEVWFVEFDPQVGQEIQKIRPAVVISIPYNFRTPDLRIVVPITTGKPHFAKYFWMIAIPQSQTNGLKSDSFADALQVKSVSTLRFKNKVGVLMQFELEAIASAIAFCIGYGPPKMKT